MVGKHSDVVWPKVVDGVVDRNATTGKKRKKKMEDKENVAHKDEKSLINASWHKFGANNVT